MSTRRYIKSVKVLIFALFLGILGMPLANLEGNASEPIIGARFPAPSPDGKQIAFSWAGDIWTVTIDGGKANRVTVHTSYEGWPCWSKEGSYIAFASKRHGSYDVFYTPVEGGEEKRLTFHSAEDIPIQWKSGKIIFLSDRYEFRATSYGVYEVSIHGGTPKSLIDYPVYTGCFSRDGEKFAFMSRPSFYTQWWRRGYKGAGNLRIYIQNISSGTMDRITTTDYNDLWPMWLRDTLYFVSERDGSKNIYRLSPGEEPIQITHHTGRGVEFPKISAHGSVIAYECEGKIWVLETLKGKCSPIEIFAISGPKTNTIERKIFEKDATEMSLSPNCKEIAFVVHGKIFIMDATGGEAKRLTQFPGRESQISWSPDGKKIAFISDKDGNEDIYVASPGDNDTTFMDCIKVDITQVTRTDEIEGRIRWSPDGRKIGYLTGASDRISDYTIGNLYTITPEGKEKKLIVSKSLIGEYSWSPDSRWIAFSCFSNLPDLEIFIVSANGGELVNISKHPEDDIRPIWSPDGTTISFLSERTGNFDIWQIPLLKSKEASTKKGKVKVEIDFGKIHKRAVQITKTKGDDELATISPDGELYAFKSNASGEFELYTIRKDGTNLCRLTIADPREIHWTPESKEIFYLSESGEISRIDLDAQETANVDFKAETEINYDEEKMQVFNEAWRLLANFFYDPNFHGVNWHKIRTEYLPYMQSCYMEEDLNDLISRMIGELNASHLFVYPEEIPQEDQTGYLGCWVEQNEKGRYIIKHVLPNGPCDSPENRVSDGEFLLEIDGAPLSADINFYSLLNYKVGKEVKLKVGKHSSGKGARIVKVRPIAKRWDFLNLCYNYWIDQKKKLTEKWSNGKIGYIHIQWMGEECFESFKQELFAELLLKEALIIDIRDNPGGWPPQEIFDIIRRKDYYTFEIADRKFRGPGKIWDKPTVLLSNRFGKSAAEMTFFAFKELGLGKVVGGMTPGYVISTESIGLLTGIGFKVPMWGIYSLERKNLENWIMEPDVYIENSPPEDRLFATSDTQLREAVDILLKEIGED